MAFIPQDTLDAMGFAQLGENVLISDKASIYNCKEISIGSNVRIDDFCVLAAGKGGIKFGDFIHIGVGCTLIGAGKITMSSFSGLSSRISVYSSSDDYTGRAMTNPTVLDEYKAVTHKDVFLGKHVIVGSGSVILPGAILEEGVAIGALSLVTKKCKAFGVYSGNPVRRIKERKRDLLAREKEFLLRIS